MSGLAKTLPPGFCLDATTRGWCVTTARRCPSSPHPTCVVLECCWTMTPDRCPSTTPLPLSTCTHSKSTSLSQCARCSMCGTGVWQFLPDCPYQITWRAQTTTTDQTASLCTQKPTRHMLTNKDKKSQIAWLNIPSQACVQINRKSPVDVFLCTCMYITLLDGSKGLLTVCNSFSHRQQIVFISDLVSNLLFHSCLIMNLKVANGLCL